MRGGQLYWAFYLSYYFLHMDYSGDIDGWRMCKGTNYAASFRNTVVEQLSYDLTFKGSNPAPHSLLFHNL